ncbi:MAG: helix-turn-helix domain-containing protein [Rhizobiaceae bacterium]|nr:helix-turn-helix domain-containing protein [Rhizobiaceae bacterium]
MLHPPPESLFGLACHNTLFWGTPNSGSIEALVFALAPTLSSIRSDLYRHIIELLVQARKDAGITQVELGKRIGQRQTFVSKFELGERRLDIAEFIEVCRAIGADPHAIIRSIEADQR